MKLTQLKALLPTINNVLFKLENGTFVPEHFHVTEVGLITKKFIDCGGTLRVEETVNFQLWSAQDTDHRLKPNKLLNIIELFEKKLTIPDADVEVEYQNQTIGKYALAFDGKNFLLQNKTTDCLAKEMCDIPENEKKINLSKSTKEATCSTPGGCYC
jgi:hypothetical protein